MNEVEKRLVKDIGLLYTALCLGVSFFLIVSFVIAYLGIVDPVISREETIWYAILSNLAAALAIVFGWMFFKRQLAMTGQSTLQEKLRRYRTISLIRAACIETASFIFMIFYIYTGEWYLLAEAIAVFGLMLYLFPKKERIAADLNENLET